MKQPLTPSRIPRSGSLLRIGSLLGLFLLSAQPPLTADEPFTPPIAEGADPWVVQQGGKYLWCQSEGNRGISLWTSDRLTSLGNRHVIWRSPDHGPCSYQACTPDKIKMEWQKPADNRHIENSAPYTGKNSKDTEYKGEYEEDQRPVPPGMLGHCLSGFSNSGSSRRARQGSPRRDSR